MLRTLKNLLFLISPIMLLMKIKHGIRINKITYNKKKRKCLVIGNGPSLNNDLANIKEDRENADIFCVNAFPLTEHFFNLKPEYFVLMDTAWWREDPNKDVLLRRNNIYNRLKDVDWKLQIIVSNNADVVFVKNQICNENIEVVKTKTVNIYRPLNSNAFKFYETGYFGPPFTNVLVFVLYIAVMAGYRDIDIYGADLSYFFLIDVDQETNKVFIKNEHFYETGEKELLFVNEGEDARGSTMHEFFQSQASTYKSHELINEFATSRGIQIYNRSSYSTIDAYPRE